MITISVANGDDWIRYPRNTIVRALHPVTLRELKPECELAFKKTIELMCKEVEL
jgi:hypothetical protein